MNKERIKATISLLERMKAENPISNKDGAEICGVYWEVVRNGVISGFSVLYRLPLQYPERMLYLHW